MMHTHFITANDTIDIGDVPTEALAVLAPPPQDPIKTQSDAMDQSAESKTIKCKEKEVAPVKISESKGLESQDTEYGDDDTSTLSDTVVILNNERKKRTSRTCRLLWNFYLI